jgi:hypothetical protein
VNAIFNPESFPPSVLHVSCGSRAPHPTAFCALEWEVGATDEGSGAPPLSRFVRQGGAVDLIVSVERRPGRALCDMLSYHRRPTLCHSGPCVATPAARTSEESAVPIERCYFTRRPNDFPLSAVHYRQRIVPSASAEQWLFAYLNPKAARGSALTLVPPSHPSAKSPAL